MDSLKNQALTSRQQRVFDYIMERHREGDIPPSLYEIQTALKLTSKTSVAQFIRALVKKGVIRIMPGKARGILPVLPEATSHSRPDERPLFIDVQLQGDTDVHDVQLQGDIVAGPAVEACPEPGKTFPISVKGMGLTKNSKPYALRARGTSMIGKGIMDGDYIVLDAAREARSGDVVAALLDGESTLKTLVKEGKQTYLKAENPAFVKMMRPKRELKVQGVMVGLVRMQS